MTFPVDYDHLKIPTPDPTYSYAVLQPQSCDEIESSINEINDLVLGPSVTEPPDDGNNYLRINGSWVVTTC